MRRDPLSLDWPGTEPRNVRDEHDLMVRSIEGNANRQRLPRSRPSLNVWGLASLVGIALGWPMLWAAWKVAQWLWSFV